jgi:PAS domain S-box-containing protein
VTDYALYLLDPSGVVTSWNPGAQRFKGYTADEIIGQHFSRFYSGEDQKLGLPARALETAAREGNFEAEGWRIRKDGTLLGLRRYRSNPPRPGRSSALRRSPAT